MNTIPETPKASPPQNFLWVDLETTGLRPETCGIVEACWFTTPLDVFKSEASPFGVQEMPIAPTAGVLWEPIAEKMHRDSGLYELCHAPEVPSLEQVEAMILETLVEGEVYYLAGASIHFDRGFILRHMPLLDKRLHYRMLDVTTLRLFWLALGDEDNGDQLPKPHRAGEDLAKSWAYFRGYVSRVKPEATLLKGRALG